MKEIKAFIRQHRIANVLQALRDSGQCDLGDACNGCHNMTVSKVQRPLASVDPTQQHYSMELAEAVVAEYKLELVCADDVADALADAIVKAAATRQAEAGWIFMSDIQRAVRFADAPRKRMTRQPNQKLIQMGPLAVRTDEVDQKCSQKGKLITETPGSVPCRSNRRSALVRHSTAPIVIRRSSSPPCIYVVALSRASP